MYFCIWLYTCIVIGSAASDHSHFEALRYLCTSLFASGKTLCLLCLYNIIEGLAMPQVFTLAIVIALKFCKKELRCHEWPLSFEGFEIFN